MLVNVIPPKYYHFDGTTRQGYFCSCCGEPCNLFDTTHSPVTFYVAQLGKKVSFYYAYTVKPRPLCKPNLGLTTKMFRANPVNGKPHFERPANVRVL